MTEPDRPTLTTKAVVAKLCEIIPRDELARMQFCARAESRLIGELHLAVGPPEAADRVRSALEEAGYRHRPLPQERSDEARMAVSLGEITVS